MDEPTMYKISGIIASAAQCGKNSNSLQNSRETLWPGAFFFDLSP
jgi:hypothetical protein